MHKTVGHMHHLSLQHPLARHTISIQLTLQDGNCSKLHLRYAHRYMTEQPLRYKQHRKLIARRLAFERGLKSYWTTESNGARHDWLMDETG